MIAPIGHGFDASIRYSSVLNIKDKNGVYFETTSFFRDQYEDWQNW